MNVNSTSVSGNLKDNLLLIYIKGDVRSGSTITSIVLGNHPKIGCVGELTRWGVFEGNPKQGKQKSQHHDFGH